MKRRLIAIYRDISLRKVNLELLSILSYGPLSQGLKTCVRKITDPTEGISEYFEVFRPRLMVFLTFLQSEYYNDQMMDVSLT